MRPWGCPAKIPWGSSWAGKAYAPSASPGPSAYLRSLFRLVAAIFGSDATVESLRGNYSTMIQPPRPQGASMMPKSTGQPLPVKRPATVETVHGEKSAATKRTKESRCDTRQQGISSFFPTQTVVKHQRVKEVVDGEEKTVQLHIATPNVMTPAMDESSVLTTDMTFDCPHVGCCRTKERGYPFQRLRDRSRHAQNCLFKLSSQTHNAIYETCFDPDALVPGDIKTCVNELVSKVSQDIASEKVMSGSSLKLKNRKPSLTVLTRKYGRQVDHRVENPGSGRKGADHRHQYTLFFKKEVLLSLKERRRQRVRPGMSKL